MNINFICKNEQKIQKYLHYDLFVNGLCGFKSSWIKPVGMMDYTEVFVTQCPHNTNHINLLICEIIWKVQQNCPIIKDPLNCVSCVHFWQLQNRIVSR